MIHQRESFTSCEPIMLIANEQYQDFTAPLLCVVFLGLAHMILLTFYIHCVHYNGRPDFCAVQVYFKYMEGFIVQYAYTLNMPSQFNTKFWSSAICTARREVIFCIGNVPTERIFFLFAFFRAL